MCLQEIDNKVIPLCELYIFNIRILENDSHKGEERVNLVIKN